MKKTLLIPLILVASIPFSGQSHAAEGANQVCQITSGPIPELAEYSRNLATELVALKAGTGCSNGITHRVSDLLGDTWANIPVFNSTLSDFAFNTKLAADGQGRTAVMRDAKIFDTNYRKIVQRAEQLAQSCGLDGENRNKISTLIKENQSLSNTFKLTAVGQAPTTMTNVRTENSTVWTAIISGYSPGATMSCTNTNSLSNATEKLTDSLLNLGGQKEKALDGWRKAIALIQ